MNPSAAAHQAVSPNEIYIDQTLYTGRPDNFTLRLPKEQRVYTLLDSLGLSYTRIDHDPTETIEAAMRWNGFWTSASARTCFSAMPRKPAFTF